MQVLCYVTPPHNTCQQAIIKIGHIGLVINAASFHLMYIVYQVMERHINTLSYFTIMLKCNIQTMSFGNYDNIYKENNSAYN